jgi:hypothetical protein
MSLNNSEFLIWKEREVQAGGQVSRQAGLFKVRLGLGEIEIYVEGKDREIERHWNKER